MDDCENLNNQQTATEYETYEEDLQLNDNDAEIIEIIGQDDCDIMGQTESKKLAKKHGGGSAIIGAGNGIETKGTAMSFGFRKKLNTTPKKIKKLLEGDLKGRKSDKCNNISTSYDGDETGTVIADDGVLVSGKDDNGNGELISKIHFEKVSATAIAVATGEISNQGVPVIGNANLPGAVNRFGYRGNQIQRPASAGITSTLKKQNEIHENMANNNCGVGDEAGHTQNNNNNGLVSNLKRRSKSAHTGRALTSNQYEQDDDTPKIAQPKSITFNLQQNSTIEYQRRQFFEEPTSTIANSGNINGRVGILRATSQQSNQRQQNVIETGMHTNVIVRPTPRAPAASYSKFTLQTVSLPKPEFAIPISLTATTPSTPGSIYTPSPITATPMTTHCGGGARAKDYINSTAQHPLTMAAQAQYVDQKTAKQMANNTTRRGFSGSREISADSGIASLDMALDSSTSSSAAGHRHGSPKRSRSRPRNLQMVMNGRHKFEVRDLDDPLSSESNSFVESLALPKLPNEGQTVPLPLSGLIRSNTILSREAHENRNAANNDKEVEDEKPIDMRQSLSVSLTRNLSDESESIDEKKLYLDRSTSEKTSKSKDSSPGSSIISSWCNNAGESLAPKDCSSLTISLSEDSNKLQEKLNDEEKLNDDDLSLFQTDMQISTISSITEIGPSTSIAQTLNITNHYDNNNYNNNNNHITQYRSDRPKSLYNTLNETKFAEIALAGSAYLLDDETSPTDSLVSSTESEEAGIKQKKHKINEELQEKDIDDISPELESGSPISPGSPTHASHSLSLSDCGNLIDDEIADQPALLFNNEAHESAESAQASFRDKVETPTLRETGSILSLKSQSKARSALQQAIELSLRTPLSVRKAVMDRAESLDTLSPCESICSDDLMMDFDINSSIDSIDRSLSVRSRSGSDLNKIDIDDAELFSDLDRKGSDVMKELNTILKAKSTRRANKESVIAHLPARATRLLNRSRLQPQCPFANNAAADSDSSKSAHSVRRSATVSRASTASNASAQLRNQQHKHIQHDMQSSSDDLMLADKSFRNAMIQDVLQFKKQLLRLRRILQETETLNPFENDNGQLFASCGLDSKLLDDIDLASLTSSITDDPVQELADLRRQSQVDDRERTIRQQRNLIEKLEAEKLASNGNKVEIAKECMNMATQTERTRPLSIGAEGLSRLQFGDQQ